MHDADDNTAGNVDNLDPASDVSDQIAGYVIERTDNGNPLPFTNPIPIAITDESTSLVVDLTHSTDLSVDIDSVMPGLLNTVKMPKLVAIL